MSLRFALSAVVSACIALLFAGCANRAEETPAAADCVIVVTTVFRGATAFEIESEVTLRLEHTLRALTGGQSVNSTSRDGQSIVTLQFSPDHDLGSAKKAVAEAVTGAAAHLPAGAERPTVTSIAGDAWPGIWLTLAAEERMSAELLAAAQRVRQRVVRIPHVAQVRVFGGRQPEFHVRCDPEKLVAYALSLEGTLKAIERATKAKPLTSEFLSNVVLAVLDDVPVRVRDVADVRDGLGPPDSLAWLDGRPTVAIGVFVHGEPAVEALQRIRSDLPQIEGALPQHVSLSLTAGAQPTSHGGLLVELLAPPGTEVKMLRKLADQFERQMRPLAASGVFSVWTRDNNDMVRLLLRAKEEVTDEAALLAALRRDNLPGVRIRVAQIPHGPAVWQQRNGVQLALMGPDRRQLAKWSTAVARRLAEAGYPDVIDETPATITDLSVKPNRDLVERFGVDPRSIARTIAAATHGVLLSERGNDRLAIRVFLHTEATKQELASLHIPAGDALVPLRALAEIHLVARPDRLHRRNMRPLVRITAALPPNGDPHLREAALRLAEEIGRELKLSGEYFVERH
jgi:multidrug efflux pump subunit AcrB